MRTPEFKCVGTKSYAAGEENWNENEQPTHRCYPMFYADSGYDNISENHGPIWLSLVDEMCNSTGPALALTRKLRGVLCDKLEERIAAALNSWMTSAIGVVSGSAGGKKVVKRKGVS